MLKNARIRNFRGLRDLKIGELSRINLIGGRNNAGKTTLLEALFILSGGANPHVMLRANRGIDEVAGSSDTVSEVLWKPLFSELDTTRTIEISADSTVLGSVALSISLSRSNTVEIPLDRPNASISEPPGNRMLMLSFARGTCEEVQGKIRTVGEGIAIDAPESNVAFPAAILLQHVSSLHGDAQMLGQLHKRKEHDIVLDALRAIAPNITAVEENSSSGHPMIWVDVGLPELLPLPTMGDGVTRVARLILAMSVVRKGVVLMDEIENGIHHSTAPEFWRVIGEVARRFDVQIIATTHSYECFEAAHEALSNDDFRYYRIETETDGKNRCIDYPPDAAKGARQFGMEVR